MEWQSECQSLMLIQPPASLSSGSAQRAGCGQHRAATSGSRLLPALLQTGGFPAPHQHGCFEGSHLKDKDDFKNWFEWEPASYRGPTSVPGKQSELLRALVCRSVLWQRLPASCRGFCRARRAGASPSRHFLPLSDNPWCVFNLLSPVLSCENSCRDRKRLGHGWG